MELTVNYTSYLARRLVFMIFVIWGVSTITFISIYIVPRNPAYSMGGSWITPDQLEKFRSDWGFDRPLHEQYLGFFNRLLHGDLGISVRTRRSLNLELVDRYPATLELATISIISVILIGIPLGVISATKRNKPIDHFARIFSLIGVSVPNFYSGLMYLIIFYVGLGWVSPGRLSPGLDPPLHITGMYTLDSLLAGNFKLFQDAFVHLIGPAFILSYWGVGIITRLTRSSMLDVLNKDYIRAARTKGVKERDVIYKHALKNALIPTITVVGLIFGAILAGAIIVESIFAWNGIGYFIWYSIYGMDLPAVMGMTLVITLIYTVINLFVDLLYGFVDPRIKYE